MPSSRAARLRRALRDLGLEREEVGHVGDALADRLRRDAVLLVVGDLDGAAAVGLVDRLPHGRRLLVGVHDHAALDVAGGAADRLDQRGLAAEEALLVGVDDRHERDLGQVEPLAQQVDADQHVELAEPQVADDLDPLERVDLRVQVADLEAVLHQVVGQVLGHLLGQGGDERALAAARRARGSRSSGRRSGSWSRGPRPRGR